jgi:hypothetical protein
MSRCNDCGTKLSNGTCPNCQEELYIFENQYEDLPEQLSNEFTDKVRGQMKDKEDATHK